MASKWNREWDRRLKTLGYLVSDQAKHYMVYVHPLHTEPVKVPHTPSGNGWDRRLSAELRRRHPDAYRVQQHRAKGRRKPRKDPEAALQAIVNAAAAERNQTTVIRFKRPRCVECGRPWLSDLNPSNRPCPQCGGEVLSAGTYRRAA